MTEKPSYVIAEEKLLALAEELGLKVTCKFVPFSMSGRKDSDWVCLSWNYTLERNGGLVLKGTYSKGVGHIPKNSYVHTDVHGGWKDYYAQLVAELGKYKKGSLCWNDINAMKSGYCNGLVPLPEPTLTEIVSGLCIDADVLSYSDFEDWCSNTGYSPDSIKAKGVYDTCIAQTIKLQASIGLTNLKELCNLAMEM